MGATFRLPGISGGAVALILGVYHKLLHSLNNIFKEFKESFKFLAVFGIAALGAFFFANWVLIKAMSKIEIISIYFFVGMILASIPTIFKDSEMKPAELKKPLNIIPFIVGAGVVIGLGFLQELINYGSLSGMGKYGFIMFAGFVAGFVFIIPGLSFATILIVLGVNDAFSSGLNGFDFKFLLPFGAGALVGFLLCARLLYVFIRKWKSQTYLAILGFLVGSVVLLLYTFVPSGAEIAWSLFAMLLGAGVVLGITWVSNSHQSNLSPCHKSQE